MIPIRDVLTRTDDILLDEDRVRWTVAERIRWMNEAMGAILIRRPAAFAVTEAHTLVAGTLQTIPEGGAVLLDVVRNLSASKPGTVIRRTDRQLLDDCDPNWHAARPKATIKHYTFDDRSPREFYVYPPAIAGTQVEVMHARLPEPVDEEDEDGELAIGPEYLETVVNYVCYRANIKDSEFASPAVATAFYQAFEAALGNKSQADFAVSPNQPTNSA